MTLVKAGWWQNTWFPSRYWNEDYWLEYGIAVPTVAPSHILLHRITEEKPRLNPHLLSLIKDYLELKQNE